MFRLEFVEQTNFSFEKSNEVAFGKITLANFSEYFESSLSCWTKNDYEIQWKEAAKRLIEFENTAFITNFYDPQYANFITWWPTWRIDNKVYIQNQLLFLSQLPVMFDTNNPYKHIIKREIEDEDGRKISEWEVNFEDIERFVFNS